ADAGIPGSRRAACGPAPDGAPHAERVAAGPPCAAPLRSPGPRPKIAHRGAPNSLWVLPLLRSNRLLPGYARRGGVLEHQGVSLSGVHEREVRMNGSVRLNGRVPRYHRIAEVLRERIHEGQLRPGARLDNQRRLAKSFGVTLMTLRQALELLEREHLISRRHGLGTFVAAPSIDYDILQLRRFAGDLQAKGEQVTTRLVGTKFALADHRVSDALG